MTPQRLAEIRKLLDGITLGEWYVDGSRFYTFRTIRSRTDDSFIAEAYEDAAFIAAAPALVAELLIEVERLEVERNAVHSMYQALTGETFPIDQLWDDWDDEEMES